MKVKEYAGFSAKPLRARVNTDDFRANYSETFAQGELTNAQVFELARDDETMGEARERLRAERERLNAVSAQERSAFKAVYTENPNLPLVRIEPVEILHTDDPRFPSAFPLGKCVCWDTGCYSCRCKDAGRVVR